MEEILRPLVFCGPSGSGKTTLIQRLLAGYPTKFKYGVSHTTRKPRREEENDVHFHYTDATTMREAVERGEFLWTTMYGGNTYGTSQKALQLVLAEGKVCVLIIDVRNIEQVRKIDPVMIFIMAPTMEELERRLRGRNTETEESLVFRMQAAKREIDVGVIPGNFHHIIVNDDIDKAYAQLKGYILQEYKF